MPLMTSTRHDDCAVTTDGFEIDNGCVKLRILTASHKELLKSEDNLHPVLDFAATNSLQEMAIHNGAHEKTCLDTKKCRTRRRLK